MYHKMTLAHKCTYSNGFHVYIWMLCSVFSIIGTGQLERQIFTLNIFSFMLFIVKYSFHMFSCMSYNYEFSQNSLKLGYVCGLHSVYSCIVLEMMKKTFTWNFSFQTEFWSFIWEFSQSHWTTDYMLKRLKVRLNWNEG